MQKKITKFFTLFIVLSLMATTIVFAASTNPSKPSSIVVDANTTNSYPLGEKLNYTRGYIYNITINESQPSQKWIGYVGNINGEYALQSAEGNALYDWDIATITGELYATKEGAAGSGQNYDDQFRNGGGIPVWGNLTCAVSSMITREGQLFNHTSTDEDSYTNTFTNGTNFNSFYAGETQIGNGVSSDCYGVFLNTDNQDDVGGDWHELVLTDMTKQKQSADHDVYHYDIIYAALLKNDSRGYDNSTYDFQILLPQTGLEGDRPNTAYYFYVELI